MNPPSTLHPPNDLEALHRSASLIEADQEISEVTRVLLQKRVFLQSRWASEGRRK
jgi:hypothetical protein